MNYKFPIKENFNFEICFEINLLKLVLENSNNFFLYMLKISVHNGEELLVMTKN